MAFEDVRACSGSEGGTADRAWFFYDILVPCIAGKKIWTSQVKVAMTITASNCVSVLDESFTVLCIENYWNKWVNDGPTKWTQSRMGNTGFLGWAKEAYERFVMICKHVKEQREEGMSEDLEQVFQKRAVMEYAGGHRWAKHSNGPAIPNFDELDE